MLRLPKSEFPILLNAAEPIFNSTNEESCQPPNSIQSYWAHSIRITELFTAILLAWNLSVYAAVCQSYDSFLIPAVQKHEGKQSDDRTGDNSFLEQAKTSSHTTTINLPQVT